LQAAPNVHFDSLPKSAAGVKRLDNNHEKEVLPLAHPAGVNSIAIDRFEGRYLLSGGSDSSIHIWDLESAEEPSNNHTHHPLGSVASADKHKYGITHLSFYAFDSGAFLSSSYDHHLNIYSSETLQASASFDLTCCVYSHAISTVADHLLVACATQLPAIKLVDLKSGAATHSLAGHKGGVMSVNWSPKKEHILASGGVDGTVRLWDVRRSAGCLGVLDMEDAVGVVGQDGMGGGARARMKGQSHNGICNGVAWSDDGEHIVSTGHDEKARVWNASTGANMLSHFGPLLKNKIQSVRLPCLVPNSMTGAGKQVMLYPNETAVLMFDIFDGTLMKTLIPATQRFATTSRMNASAAEGSDGLRRMTKGKSRTLAWRNGHVEFYSAQSDGQILAWKPFTFEDAEVEKEAAEEAKGDADYADDERQRKRQALGDIFKELTKQKITFT
jgi:DNA excision repair protein ERCC-8